MKWQGRRKSGNLDDRRGMSKGKLAAGGGIVVTIIVLALNFFGGETGQQLAPIVEQLGNSQTVQQTEQRELTAQEKEMGNFMATVLADTEDVWNQIFTQNNIGDYKEPTMVLFTDAVSTACGNASSASGPFYCPADQKVYMDLAFFDELKTRFGAKGGDFAIAYVTAHEIGHHVQTLLGTSQKVTQLQRQNRSEANRLSVALELQADFYAGLWAHYNQEYLEEGDIEEALSAANAVGDDAIQKRTQGDVVPDSFTHGSSEQRMKWFMKGYKTGDIKQGDTFSEILN
ncbi:KPN_02809 family neutral zinc metallopeptidase [Aequorivita vladivostokensis]|jgi:predicted metalloprotease|uniref:Metalloprotease n=1 Tax=Aequorivita vladivostokensis TaxID=171194 RepID=A0ABR5DMD0_9FLAO|nr:neutral zinc metallopeptidase [Aequorivita vladivostokensis]KJJ39936.1 metalloprotease [Aequorivita vladivostokensis]MAB56888.1 metalloprotease [Aequorivita sp.]MBF30941.1 metalloprotease [Aequorivita sp.]HBL78779.1 metalloprotease [Aequorivita sp.]|tara:strand:- start:21684 stop:22541 length:858 start_codon:yes stop_codon:yes gene_type:complete